MNITKGSRVSKRGSLKCHKKYNDKKNSEPKYFINPV